MRSPAGILSASSESTTDFCENVLSGLDKNSPTRYEKSLERSFPSINPHILVLITLRAGALVALS